MARLKQLLVVLLLAGLNITSYAQKQPKEELCLKHGGTPWDSKKYGSRALCDGCPGVVCPTCRQIQEEITRKAKSEEERHKQYYSEQNVKMRRAQEEVARQKKKDLDALVHAQEVEVYNEMKRKKDEKHASLFQKYYDRNEAVARQLNEQLERIQQANAVKAVPAGEEDFWNETVELASYEPVQDPKGSWYGYKNKNGDLKIGYQYSKANPFYKGVAAIQENSGKWKLINSQGKVVADFSSTKISSIENFNDGVAVTNSYAVGNDNEYGAIDTKGNILFGPSFYKIEPFKNGVAMAIKFIREETVVAHSCKSGNCGKVSGFDVIYYEKGIIDKRGNWVESPAKQFDTDDHYRFVTDERPEAWAHTNFIIDMESWFQCLTGHKSPLNSSEWQTWNLEVECRVRGNDEYEKQYDAKIVSLHSQGYTELKY